MNSTWFSYDGFSIEVASDQTSDLSWLAEFLGPSFEQRTGCDPRNIHQRVLLSEDRPGFERLQRLAHPSTTHCVGFVLDSGPLELNTFHDQGATVAVDEAFDVFYLRQPSGTLQIMDAHQASPRHARVALMRVVREYAMHHSLRQGRIFLHASAVARNGRAVLFTGPKQAGKTSLVCASLYNRPACGLLANDRVLVAHEASGWQCRGMPSIVSVRPGSFTVLPWLHARVQQFACGHTRFASDVGPARLLNDGRYGLSPAQFCQLLNTQPVATAMASAIAFPRLDPTISGARAHRLNTANAAERLTACLFAASGLGTRSELFDLPESGRFPSPLELQNQARQFAAEIPCFEVRLGPHAYQPEHIDPLLDQLLG